MSLQGKKKKKKKKKKKEKKNKERVLGQTTWIAIGLDKSGYQVKFFSYFSSKTYVVGTH